MATFLKAGITEKAEGEENEEGGENLRIRRTVIRYLILSYVLCLRRISSKVRSKYPDMDSLVASHLIRDDEVKIFQISFFFPESKPSRLKRLAARITGSGWARMGNMASRTGGCRSSGASALSARQ